MGNLRLGAKAVVQFQHGATDLFLLIIHAYIQRPFPVLRHKAIKAENAISHAGVLGKAHPVPVPLRGNQRNQQRNANQQRQHGCAREGMIEKRKGRIFRHPGGK